MILKAQVQIAERAGRAASERSAHVEAMAHLTQSLSPLPVLPDTPERARMELDLAVVLAPALLITKGYAAAEAAQVYHRIQQLCRQVGDEAQVFPALYGLRFFHLVQGACQTARQVGEQAFRLARQVQAPECLVPVCMVLGLILFYCGDLHAARARLEEGLTHYNPAPRPLEVEACFQQALAIARRQQAK